MYVYLEVFKSIGKKNFRSNNNKKKRKIILLTLFGKF